MNFIVRAYRRIQFHIVTIFLLLLTISTLIIMFYIYNRNYKGIVDLSTDIILEVDQKVTEKINGVLGQARLLGELTEKVIVNGKVNQDVMIPYMINALIDDPKLTGINLAMTNGDYLSVLNLSYLEMTQFISKNQPLPEGAKYIIRTIQNGKGTWKYLGTDLSVLAVEEIPSSSYDPRKDVWFTSMQSWPGIRWENSLLPKGSVPNKQEVITVSVPVMNKREFVGVIGVNLSMLALSNFITHQKIGKSGKAFILDSDGKLLIPPPAILDAPLQKMVDTLILDAYKQYTQTKQPHFIVKKERVRYILNFDTLRLDGNTKWTIVLAVPFTDFFGRIIQTQKQTIFISIIILGIFGFLVYLSAKHISVPIIQLAREVDRIRNFDFDSTFRTKSHIDEIVALDTSVLAMRNALRSFSRYIPKEIVKTLVQQGKEITLGGERKELTVLFSDITDFTATSEATPLDELMPTLAKYFDAMSKIILASDGTIDKYIGDSVMAFWGAPQPVSDPIHKACLAALRCHQTVNVKALSLPPWKTRFGIHTGDVIVGNIGTIERMNYTVIGDVVNTTSRLCAINKQYGTSIVISDAVQQKLGGGYIIRPLDFVAVKGKKNKILIYELAGTTEGELKPSSEKIELCNAFTKAYQTLQKGDTASAKTQFLAISKQFPNDMATKVYIERLAVTS